MVNSAKIKLFLDNDQTMMPVIIQSVDNKKKVSLIEKGIRNDVRMKAPLV